MLRLPIAYIARAGHTTDSFEGTVFMDKSAFEKAVADFEAAIDARDQAQAVKEHADADQAAATATATEAHDAFNAANNAVVEARTSLTEAANAFG
jgi:uncharacterized protein HemY